VTVARAFTDSFAGIEPSSVPGFVIAQLAGAAIGIALIALLFPAERAQTPAAADLDTGHGTAEDLAELSPAAAP